MGKSRAGSSDSQTCPGCGDFPFPATAAAGMASTPSPMAIRGLRKDSQCRQDSSLVDHILLCGFSKQEKVGALSDADRGHQVASGNSQGLPGRGRTKY